MRNSMGLRKCLIAILTFTILATVLYAGGSRSEAATGTWKKDSGGYRYSYSNGSYARNAWVKWNGKWYYFGSGGYMQKGWKKISGKWYYFGKSGNMQTGWKKISGKWYYFGKSGSMQTGWKKISGKWYYFGKSGSMQTGWKKISGKWYYFGKSGNMQTGWISLSGKWYYCDKNGVMLVGRYKLGGKWYKFDESGIWLKDNGLAKNRKRFKKLLDMAYKCAYLNQRAEDDPDHEGTYYEELRNMKPDPQEYNIYIGHLGTPLNTITYDFRDLNSDGKDELILKRDGDFILGMYSEKNGNFSAIYAVAFMDTGMTELKTGVYLAYGLLNETVCKVSRDGKLSEYLSYYPDETIEDPYSFEPGPDTKYAKVRYENGKQTGKSTITQKEYQKEMDQYKSLPKDDFRYYQLKDYK